LAVLEMFEGAVAIKIEAPNPKLRRVIHIRGTFLDGGPAMTRL
jgi:hypothetical protein